MPPFASFLPLLALLSLSVTASDTVYDVLRSHGLPMGLLPRGVQSFEIDDGGNFEVRLGRLCTAKFENEVRYEANVSGTISYGQIGALKGVSAQELFLWFPVKGIRVDIPSSGIIYFDVGVIFKQFSLSQFETPPECHDPESVLEKGGDLSESGKLRHSVDNNVLQKAAM